MPDFCIKCQLSLPGPWASLSWMHNLITVAPRETYKVSELFSETPLQAASPPHTLMPLPAPTAAHPPPC